METINQKAQEYLSNTRKALQNIEVSGVAKLAEKIKSSLDTGGKGLLRFADEVAGLRVLGLGRGDVLTQRIQANAVEKTALAHRARLPWLLVLPGVVSAWLQLGEYAEHDPAQVRHGPVLVQPLTVRLVAKQRVCVRGDRHVTRNLVV